jgi:superfamily I DNA and/or RNA helicase
VELYGYLLHHYPNSYSGGVGIITGYQAQKHLLIRLFKQRFGFNWKLGGRPNKNSSQRGGTVEISTVDGFQGREKDVIIFSCVRSSSTQSQVRTWSNYKWFFKFNRNFIHMYDE